MMPGMGSLDPKKMSKMMKKMGIDTQEIEANKVKIEGDKNYIVKNPKVSIINMQGQEIIQVMGKLEEADKESFDDEDVEMVVVKTGVSEEKAREELKKTDGDLAEAIINLSD